MFRSGRVIEGRRVMGLAGWRVGKRCRFIGDEIKM